MNFTKTDFITPEFLFCEIPVKDNNFNDDRTWVYHPSSLSLIEFINVDHFPDFQFKGKQDRFEYQEENWFGVFAQNNCEATNNNDDDIIKKAWQFFSNYLTWEHNQK